MATRSPRAAPSPKPARESAALRRTMGSGSWISPSRAAWNGGYARSWPMIHAAVWRISRLGLAVCPITLGYQRAAFRPCDSRSPNCTRACWMCRGLEVSAKYASRSESESLRPNHVLYQNRKGNSTSARANSAISKYARRPGRLCARGGWGDMRDSSYRAGGLIAVEEGVEEHYDLGIFCAGFARFRDSAHGAAPGLAGPGVDDPDVADAEVEEIADAFLHV